MTTTQPDLGNSAPQVRQRRGQEMLDPQGEWKDTKKYTWILSLVPAAIPLILWGLWAWMGQLDAPAGVLHVVWWLGPFAVFVLIPFTDAVLGRDGENVPEEFVPWLEETKFYRVVSFLYFPIMFASLLACCHLWTRGDLQWFDSIGLAWSMGMTSGIGIVAAHELGHKKGSFESWLGKICLAVPAYGHHVKVATPEDPVSARMGGGERVRLPPPVRAAADPTGVEY